MNTDGKPAEVVRNGFLFALGTFLFWLGYEHVSGDDDDDDDDDEDEDEDEEGED